MCLFLIYFYQKLFNIKIYPKKKLCITYFSSTSVASCMLTVSVLWSILCFIVCCIELGFLQLLLDCFGSCFHFRLIAMTSVLFNFSLRYMRFGKKWVELDSSDMIRHLSGYGFGGANLTWLSLFGEYIYIDGAVLNMVRKSWTAY